MLASLDPLGLTLVVDVVSGERADDPLYLPCYRRVKQVLPESGLLVIGDSKMSALNTRATVVAEGDFYLTPLAYLKDEPGLLEELLAPWANREKEMELIYLHDCGYRNLSLYDAVVENGDHFVSRYHSKISFHMDRELSLSEECELSNGYLLTRDRIGTLGQREDADQPMYRLINILDSQGKPIVIVTSLLDLPVEQVCLLYFYRWTIEILFRWLKHTLSLAHLISHSPNGIMMQVVSTLLVYVLLVLYHQGGPLSLKHLLRQLRFQLHDRLYQLGYEQGRRDALARQASAGNIPAMEP